MSLCSKKLGVVLHRLPEDTDLLMASETTREKTDSPRLLLNEISWQVTNLNKNKVALFPPLPNLLS